MSEPKYHPVDDDAGTQIYIDLPNYVDSDMKFRAAVRAGIASYQAGPTYDLATVEVELRDSINSED